MSLIIPAPKPLVHLTVTAQRQTRIVFFGTPLFTVPVLRALHAHGWPIAAAVTAPDRPVGRRMLLTPSPIKTAAEELGIPVLAPATLKDEEFFTAFTELRPDLCVVAAYNKIIPQRYLESSRHGFLNIHPSLLPLYRGPSPVRSAILDGRASTGVSIMVLDAEMDHGPLLAQESWTIPGGLDAPACEEELFRLGARMLTDSIPGYMDGTRTATSQDHAAATYCGKFARPDGRLDWSQPAPRINDRIRALADSPGTWTTWNDKVLNVFHAHVITESIPEHPAGTVFIHAGQPAVACGSFALALETLQLEGSTRQAARDFTNGRPSFVGAVLI